MASLGSLARGRDNNFNLIRMVAASAVLVSHAWPLVHGPGTIEPLEAETGHTLGAYAVYVFFVLSGFFISASFARSASLGAFLAARALRLFPGLAVSLVLVGFVLGPMVTSLPLAEYLSDRGTWAFMPRNLTLWSAQFTLPGVFEANPYPAVEGSIWTLVQEVMCYALVFLAGVAGLLRRRAWMTSALLVYGALWLGQALHPLQLHPKMLQLHDLSMPFVLGMTFWLWRDRIPMAWPLILALALLAWVGRGTVLAFPLLMLMLAYATFWLGLVPHGIVRRYNRLGDYSYGMYVYAFPLQGLIVWLFGPMTPLAHIALAFPLTLLPAVLSWRLIEAPALALRRKGAA